MRRISEIAAEYVRNFAESIKKQGSSVYFIVLAATFAAWLIFPFINYGASESGATMIKGTPFSEISYGSGRITLESLKGASKVSYSGYGYIPEVEAKFDLSELSEKERYWLIKDGSLRAFCSVRSKQNGIEDLTLDVAGTKTDGDVVTVTFGAGDEEEWKRPFDDMQTALSFVVTTEEDAGDGPRMRSDFYVALDDARNPVHA